MRESDIVDIAIIGGGYSGTITAVHLMKGAPDPAMKLLLVDRARPGGRGLAYGTWDDNFLLNVPAGNMSALDGSPQHFVDYCRTIDPAFNEGSFVSRRIYGDYLQHTLRDAQQHWPGTLEQSAGQVMSVRPEAVSGVLEIRLADGRLIRAAKVVLALGHFAPKVPFELRPAAQGGDYIENPWGFSALGSLPDHLPVLLVGSGLTAIDALFRIHSNGNRKVTLLSRKGLLPQGHRPTPKQPAHVPFPRALEKPSLSVLDCMRHLRRNAQRHLAEGGDWRDAINELRAHTPEIWQRWSGRERKKFLRHAVGYWDVHRHRLAPVADSRLKEMLASGSADILAGRLVDCTEEEGGYAVRIRLRGSEKYRTLTVGAIVNCTGPNADLATISDPLIQQLLTDGLLVADEAKIGLLTGASYEVIGSNGEPVRNLFYVGPMLKAGFWEAIAVPELRQHTRQLAQELIRSFAR